jgi:EmrB/QacA subfamily drug resistance transporter
MLADMREGPVVPAHNRLLPLLISATFMMESLDSTMISTPLPMIARDLGVDPIQAKAALTSYFLATAALIPLSNWLSDRFGPRRIFTAAITVFTLGSLLCAIAPTLGVFVAARLLQGAGAALMFPVGRIILLRSVSKKDLVRTLSLVSILPALALVIGPLLAGYVATFADWRLLFLINGPIGVAGMVLALFFVPRISETPKTPFDGTGFMLSSVGLVALGWGLGTLGGRTIPPEMSVGLVVLGALLVALYVKHARQTASAILDLSLLRYRTFRIAVSSSFVVRAAVVGALPFLLPMMLQVGFGLSAFESGSITFIGAVATLMTRFLIGPMLRLLGFRSFLAGTALFGMLSMLFLAFVTETTPHVALMAIIFLGTLFRVLQILGLDSVIFTEVRPSEMGQASCLLSVVKQLAASAGVAYVALVLQGTELFKGGPMAGGDIRTAIVFVAVPLVLTVILSFRLSSEDGAEIAGRGTATKGLSPPPARR